MKLARLRWFLLIYGQCVTIFCFYSSFIIRNGCSIVDANARFGAKTAAPSCHLQHRLVVAMPEAVPPVVLSCSRKYSRPPRIRHPLNDSVLWSLVLCLVKLTLAFVVVAPIFCFLWLIFVLLWPAKIIYYLSTKRTRVGLMQYLCSSTHCHPFWAFGLGAKLDNWLLVHSLEPGVDALDLQKMICRRLNSAKEYYRQDLFNECRSLLIFCKLQQVLPLKS